MPVALASPALPGHKMRNLQSKASEPLWSEFKARAAGCHQAASPALARLLRDDIVAKVTGITIKPTKLIQQ